jgi:hypothetical protein
VVVYYENPDGQEYTEEILDLDINKIQKDLSITKDKSFKSSNSGKANNNRIDKTKKSKLENWDQENETDITLIREIREIDEKIKQNREYYYSKRDSSNIFTETNSKVRNSGFKKPSDLSLNNISNLHVSKNVNCPFEKLIKPEEVNLNLGTPSKESNNSSNNDIEERKKIEKEKLLANLNMDSILDIDIIQKLNLIESFGESNRTGLKTKKEQYKTKNVDNYNDEVYFNKTNWRKNKSMGNTKKISKNNIELPVFAFASEKESDRDTLFDGKNDKSNKKDDWKTFASYFQCS